MNVLNAAQRMQMIEKFETLTMNEYEALNSEIEQLRQRVAELETQLAKNNPLLDEAADAIDKLTAERDKATQYWQIAEGRCDALKQQRDELLAAIKKFLDENNPEGFGCACEPDRLCGPCSEAKRQRPLYAAIASVEGET